jgi:hypothetical protein
VETVQISIVLDQPEEKMVEMDTEIRRLQSRDASYLYTPLVLDTAYNYSDFPRDRSFSCNAGGLGTPKTSTETGEPLKGRPNGKKGIPNGRKGKHDGLEHGADLKAFLTADPGGGGPCIGYLPYGR